MQKEKIIDLARMFPAQVVLFSTEQFEARFVPFKFAQAYLNATKEAGKKLMWIATDQPADKVPSIFADYKFPIKQHLDRMLFLDLVSSGAGIGKPESDLNIRYVKNPNNLVEISMTLSDMFADKSVGLAVIDGINGLLTFNKTQSVLKLLHFLPSIARQTNTTILLTFERGQYKDLETAVRICTDASFVVENKNLILRTRMGTERIPLR